MDERFYNRTIQYCDNYKKTLSQGERDFILRKTIESYYETLQKKVAEKGTPLEQHEKDMIFESILSDAVLHSHAVAATEYYSNIIDTYRLDFEKKNKRKILIDISN